jgi:hypothetical protein
MIRFAYLLILFFFTPMTVFSQSLAVNKIMHDFGTVEFDKGEYCTFKLTNVSDSTLIIYQFKTSSQIVTVDCPVDTLLPNQSTFLKVNYDFKKPGPINKSISVYYKSIKDEILILRIRGFVLNQN